MLGVCAIGFTPDEFRAIARMYLAYHQKWARELPANIWRSHYGPGYFWLGAAAEDV